MKNAAALAALILIYLNVGQAQELSQQSFFNRCYSQLTGRPVPLGHALMSNVVSGKITALAACKQILRKGQLNAQGEVSSRTDVEAKAVLNTFYGFHRSWFPVNNFDSVPGYNSSEHIGNIDIYDATEPALALTYTVLGLNQKYSSVLTRSTGVSAVRVTETALETRLGFKTKNPSRIINASPEWATAPFSFRDATTANTAVSRNIQVHVSQKLSMPTLQTGELVGIKPTTTSFIVPNISLQTGNRATDKGSLYPTLNYSYDFFKTQGGGVLGTPIYMLQYYGHGQNMKFNGQSKLARRWSQQNMESFLCASLPALRESDVANMVDTKSTAAFRNAKGCIMCHATLDPMAYTARNVTVGSMDFFRPTQDGVQTREADGTLINPPVAFFRNATAITTYKSDMASVSGWPSAEVANFHLQKPTGRLYFRSVTTGALIDKTVSNITTLGAAMAETDDFYTCAAKRYFEFMTGINVPLYDRTDPNNSGLNSALSNQAIADREYVEQLARGLRSSGSVIQMVEDIMGSDYYAKENFR